MENSNLTRRSFIKKSSYSAAAVTVLGTGVALGDVSNPLPGATYTVRTVIYKMDNSVVFTTTAGGLTNAQVIEKTINELSVFPDNGINTPGPTGGSTSEKDSTGACDQIGEWVITSRSSGNPSPNVVSNGSSLVNGVLTYSFSVTFNSDYTIVVTNFKS